MILTENTIIIIIIIIIFLAIVLTIIHMHSTYPGFTVLGTIIFLIGCFAVIILTSHAINIIYTYNQIPTLCQSLILIIICSNITVITLISLTCIHELGHAIAAKCEKQRLNKLNDSKLRFTEKLNIRVKIGIYIGRIDSDIAVHLESHRDDATIQESIKRIMISGYVIGLKVEKVILIIVVVKIAFSVWHYTYHSLETLIIYISAIIWPLAFKIAYDSYLLYQARTGKGSFTSSDVECYKKPESFINKSGQPLKYNQEAILLIAGIFFSMIMIMILVSICINIIL